MLRMYVYMLYGMWVHTRGRVFVCVCLYHVWGPTLYIDTLTSWVLLVSVYRCV